MAAQFASDLSSASHFVFAGAPDRYLRINLPTAKSYGKNTALIAYFRVSAYPEDKEGDTLNPSPGTSRMRMGAENTITMQRGRPFRPGQSGNPAGRPKGARNRATLAAEALLEGEAEALTRKAIELALAGDPLALRLCLERIVPPRKERPIALPLPAITSSSDVPDAIATVLAAVAQGVLAPAEAAELAKVVDTFAKAIEMRDFDSRLTALEKEYGEEP